MPKEKSVNPVQAQHKSDKKQALKKQKTQQQAQRNERLAKRNPSRLEKQIADLQALEAQSTGGQLRPRDKQTLEQLQKDLKAVQRARESLGDAAPQFHPRRDGAENDGDGPKGRKRRFEDEDGEITDPEVRGIPMPRDTPPPVPRRGNRRDGVGVGERKEEVKPAPVTTYSSAPVLRNLASENKRFVPAAVRQNLQRQRGEGGRLLEPEELDRLERAGYQDAEKAAGEGSTKAEVKVMAGEGTDKQQPLMTREETERMKREGARDVRGVVDEMEKEAEYEIMAASAAVQKSEGGLPRQMQDKMTDSSLRQVEMEEVEDEDL